MKSIAIVESATGATQTQRTHLSDKNYADFDYTITPALSVTVDSDKTIYTSDTFEEIADKITVKSISASGEVSPDALNADALTVTLKETDPAQTMTTAGKKTFVVSSEGLSAEFEATVTLDEVTGVGVSGTFKKNYESGDTFDPTGMTVAAYYESTKSKTITDYTVYSTSNTPASGMPTLKVGDEVYVCYGGAEIKVTDVVVSKKSVTVPTADGTYTYSGSEQTFTVGSNTDAAFYTITGDHTTSGVTKGTNAGSYTATVALKDTAESQWSDTTIASKGLTWTIGAKDVTTPTIELNKNTFEYTGSAIEPSVTVKDGDVTIDASEYTVTYDKNTAVSEGADAANKPVVTVTDKANGNYNITTTTTNFEITKKAPSYTAPTAKTLTFSGSAQNLVTAGTSDDGTVKYCKTENGTYSETVPQETNAGEYTVWYKVIGDANHSDTQPVSVAVTIGQKEITVPTADTTTFTYTGSEQIYTVAASDDYTVSGNEQTNAGDYTVTVTLKDTDNTKWATNFSGKFAFHIGKADSAVSAAPTPTANLIYSGADQTLVSAGRGTGGTMVYCLTQTGSYSETIPQGKAVDEYTVWYKILGDVNHNDTTPASVTASIGAAAMTAVSVSQNGTLSYTGEALTPNVNTAATTVGDAAKTFTYGTVAGTYGAMPTFTDAGTYTVYYKVSAANHTDYTGSFTVTVGKHAAKTGVTLNMPVYYGNRDAQTITYAKFNEFKNESGAAIESIATATNGDTNSLLASVTNSGFTLGTNATKAAADAGYTATLNVVLSCKNYENTTATVTVSLVNKTAVTVALANKTMTYGDSYTPAATATKEGFTAVSNCFKYEYKLSTAADSTYTETQPTDVGTYTIRVSYEDSQANGGVPGYIGTTTATLTIEQKNVSSGVSIADIEAPTYTGSKLTPALTVKFGTKAMELNTDYTVEYTNSTNAGTNTAKATITGTGNYTGTLDKYFSIDKADSAVSAAPTPVASLIYSGEGQTLVSAGSGTGGTMVYCLTQTGSYSETLSTATAAGEHTVWYKIKGDDNHNDTTPASVTASIGQKEITISGIAAVGRAYNGYTSVELSYTNVVYGGICSGDSLSVTATGTMADADVDENKTVTLSNLTLGGTSIANYKLAASGQQTTTTVTITKKPAELLTVTAQNAVYTGVAYDAANKVTANRDSNLVTLTFYADNSGVKGEEISAPVNAGTYWVSGSIAESKNIAAASATAVKFSVTKAPLTITAKDVTITYGEAPEGDGVEYDGFVNSETAATADVTGTVAYEYSYEQYGDIGEYTVTAKTIDFTNYEETFAAGTLTVEAKEVGLNWSGNTGNLYYNGQAKSVTATATYTVNGDTVAVTVIGGTEKEMGSYVATASALTGDKAGNYKLPAENTTTYSIISALDVADLTFKMNGSAIQTVTATVNGLTIKLVGYIDEGTTLTVHKGVSANSNDKITVNGVTFTIDRTGVIEKSAKVEVKAAEKNVTLPDAAATAAGVSVEVMNALSNDATKSEGLTEAAAQILKDAGKEAMPEGATKVEMTMSLQIAPKAFSDDAGAESLKLDITPVVTKNYKNDNGQAVGDAKQDKISNDKIKAPITISVQLPVGMLPANKTSEELSLFAKHTLGTDQFEMLPVTVTGSGTTLSPYIASWQQSSFSEVELKADKRSAEVSFLYEDGHIQAVTLTPANIGEALTVDTKADDESYKYEYKGWKFSDGSVISVAADSVFTVLTDALLTELSGKSDLVANSQFEQTVKYSFIGGVVAVVSQNFEVSVAKTENGTASVDLTSAKAGKNVTITLKANEGYQLDSIKVVDGNGLNVAVTKVSDTKYTFTMPSSKVSVSAVFAAKVTAMNFSDVTAADWFYEAVQYAYTHGLMNGVGNDQFAPQATTTRAMVWAILARNAGQSIEGATWASDARSWAMANSVSDGTDMSGAVTREQLAKMLYSYSALKGCDVSATAELGSFRDAASVSTWAESMVKWAVGTGIIKGANGNIKPAGNATRAEVATMLMRYFELNK